MKRLLLVALAASGSAFALVERTIDEKSPFEVTLSTSSHNRIVIEDGAVEKIFADNGLFTVVMDAATGNAFVNVEQEIEEPKTVTVVASSGAVQDLFVLATAGPSEQVRLHLPEDGQEWTYRADPSMAASIQILNQIVEGIVPAGFGEREWDGEGLKLPSPLIAVPLKSLEGPFEILDVYEVRNPGKKGALLSLEDVKREQTWAFLGAKSLDSGEKTICILGRGKDG